MDKSEQFFERYKRRFYFSFLATFLGLKHTSVDMNINAYVFLTLFWGCTRIGRKQVIFSVPSEIWVKIPIKKIKRFIIKAMHRK